MPKWASPPSPFKGVSAGGHRPGPMLRPLAAAAEMRLDPLRAVAVTDGPAARDKAAPRGPRRGCEHGRGDGDGGAGLGASDNRGRDSKSPCAMAVLGLRGSTSRTESAHDRRRYT